MTSSRQIVFMAESATGAQALLSSGTGGMPKIYPQNAINWTGEGAKRVTWTLRIHSASSHPSFKLSARFLGKLYHTGGPGGSAPIRFPFPASKASAITEGVGWHSASGTPPVSPGDFGVIHAAGDPTGLVISRTVEVQESCHYIEFKGEADAGVEWWARVSLVAQTHSD